MGVSGRVRAAGVVGRQMSVSDRTGAANSSASGFGENGGELKTKKGKEYVMQDGDICHFRFNV